LQLSSDANKLVRFEMDRAQLDTVRQQLEAIEGRLVALSSAS